MKQTKIFKFTNTKMPDFSYCKYFFLIVIFFSLTSFAKEIIHTGRGTTAPIQEGLQIELQSAAQSAQISFKNTTKTIITIFKMPMFVKVLVTEDNKNINPNSIVRHKTSSRPYPDDFLLIGPGQTVILPVRLNFSDNKLKTYSGTYIFKKNKIYKVQVKIYPYSPSLFHASKKIELYNWPNLIKKEVNTNTLSYILK